MTLLGRETPTHLAGPLRSRRAFLVLWPSAGALLSACVASRPEGQSAGAGLPAFATRSVPVRTSYLFALSDGATLEALPCYCGCVDLRHTSLRSCFLDDAGGFDPHAAGCDVCVAETLDARRLHGEKWSLMEIRRQIDDKYGSGGRGTITPLPAAQ